MPFPPLPQAPRSPIAVKERHTHSWDDLSRKPFLSEISFDLLQSEDFVSGTSGFYIGVDGTAEFNTGMTIGGGATIDDATIEGNLTLGTGGVFRSAASGKRVEITNTDGDQITFYSGLGGELAPGFFEVTSDDPGKIQMRPPQINTNTPATLSIDENGTMQFQGKQSNLTTLELLASGGGSSNVQLQLAPFASGVYADTIRFDLGVGNVYSYGAGSLSGAAGATHAFRIASDYWYLSSDQLISIGDGTAALPVYTFGGDEDTGIYRVSANQLGISVAGQRTVSVGEHFLIVSDTSLNDADPRLTAQGSASTPAFTFRGDTNTGMYRIGSDNIGFAVGASKRLDVGLNDVKVNGGANEMLRVSAAIGVQTWNNSGSLPHFGLYSPGNFNPASASTWTTIGTDQTAFNHVGTDADVTVWVECTGVAANNNATNILCSLRIQVSWDNGSTWTTGQAIQTYAGTNAGRNQQATIACGFLATGTATNDVKVRLQAFRGGTITNFIQTTYRFGAFGRF